MPLKKTSIYLLLLFPVLSQSCFSSREKLPVPAEKIIVSCSDGIKNGNEADVDCGGDCGLCYTTPACTLSADRYQLEGTTYSNIYYSCGTVWDDNSFKITLGSDNVYLKFLYKPTKSGNYMISADSSPNYREVYVTMRHPSSLSNFVAQSGMVHVKVTGESFDLQFCNVPVKGGPFGEASTASAHLATICK